MQEFLSPRLRNTLFVCHNRADLYFPPNSSNKKGQSSAGSELAVLIEA